NPSPQCAPRGAVISTVALRRARTETTRVAPALLLPVPADERPAEGRPLPPMVGRARAARHGAGSTTAVVPARCPPSASTPCSRGAGAAGVIAPGAPAGPPGTVTAAVTGTLDVITTAPTTPDSEVSSIRLAEPAGTSIALPPVGWYVPPGETTLSLTCASFPPGSAR